MLVNDYIYKPELLYTIEKRFKRCIWAMFISVGPHLLSVKLIGEAI